MFLTILFNSKENISGDFFDEVEGRRPQAYFFIKKETPAQVEICKYFEEHHFIEQLWMSASGYIRILAAKKFQYQS